MRKILTAAFLTGTLATTLISAHALAIKPKTNATCGTTCIAPKLSCPGGCFCDLSLGNGIDTGVCVSKH